MGGKRVTVPTSEMKLILDSNFQVALDFCGKLELRDGDFLVFIVCGWRFDDLLVYCFLLCFKNIQGYSI